jgi:protein-tyrosine phosphatase
MRAEIYWVGGVAQGRLAVMPRPRGGDWLEDEVGSLRQSGVDTLVCLLTPEEMAELDVEQEAACCAAGGIAFLPFPVPDRGVPESDRETLGLVRSLAALLDDGKAVAVHCRQGVGRTALVAACVLAAFGEEPDAAFERVARARGCPVPDTTEQRDWVRRFVDRYLRGPDTG